MKQDKEKVELKKEIGILGGFSLVTGIIIGSGIFVSPTGVLENTKSAGLSLIVWLFTGGFCALGALVYAELGVTIPKSGGEYSYILEAFGPLPAFLALWITFVVIGAAAVAANSLVFAEYVLKAVPQLCEVPQEVTIAFINCYRVKWGSWISIISTASKLIALGIIFIFGIIFLARGRLENFQNAFEGSSYHPGALANAVYQSFWSYMGWSYLGFISGEISNPERKIPIIIMLSLSAVTVVYVLANVAYFAVLSPPEILSEVSGGGALAVAFARACMGDFYYVMPIIVGASVFGNLNGNIFTMSRSIGTSPVEAVYIKDTHDFLPLVSFLFPYIVPITWKSVPSGVPIKALLSLCFVLYRDINYIIGLVGLSFTIISDLAVLGLLYIRRTRPEMNKTTFKLPVIVPIGYLVLNTGIGALTVYQSPRQSFYSLLMMLAGIPIYLVGIVWKKPASVDAKLVNCTRWMQKIFKSVPQEKDREGLDSTSDDYDAVIEVKMVRNGDIE